MNRKNVEDVLRRKFNHWAKSIEDPDIQSLVKANTVITGGCIVSLLENQPVNDFDIYFTDKRTAKKVAKYYVDKFNIKNNAKAMLIDGSCSLDDHLNEYGSDYYSFIEKTLNNTPDDRIKIVVKSEGVAEDLSHQKSLEDADNVSNIQLEEFIQQKQKDTEKGKYNPVFLSPNAITLTDKIQIVIRFYGSPEEIHKNFDFVHCTNYWLSSNDRLYTNKDALESLISKQLYYVGSKYPLCSIFRTRKFLKRGWHINAGQYLKMAMQLNELDLKDVNVLEDQLVGVDTLYFLELISMIRKEFEYNPNINIDSTYIATLVDKIF